MDGDDGGVVPVVCMEYTRVGIANAEAEVSEGTFEVSYHFRPACLSP
jgi:hypothetical protein